MNIVYLSFKNIVSRPLSSLLSWLLLSFGVCIVVLILQLADNFRGEVTKNTAGVDLVIGSKGSPLQIILSSIFHVDFPTGNIALQDIKPFTKNRYIEYTIPLSLGDSYGGFRIVGTIEKYGALYHTDLQEGSWFRKPLQAVIGSQVAEELHLELGDKFTSQHGLSDEGEDHEDQGFEVVGILKPSVLVIDQLILVDLESVWLTHNHLDHLQEDDSSVYIADWDIDLTQSEIANQQVTSLLIKYRSPMGAVMLPNQINQTSNLQAASPAYEASRLFNILENVINVMNILGIIIIIISGISVFISLLNSLKDRKYEIAIMRSMGASRTRVFTSIMFEGIFITVLGVVAGFVLGHGIMLLLFQKVMGRIPAYFSLAEGEGFLLITCLVIGIFAAVVPALLAYRTDISKTLAQG